MPDTKLPRYTPVLVADPAPGLAHAAPAPDAEAGDGPHGLADVLFHIRLELGLARDRISDIEAELVNIRAALATAPTPPAAVLVTGGEATP